jgi:hypothetical protein
MEPKTRTVIGFQLRLGTKLSKPDVEGSDVWCYLQISLSGQILIYLSTNPLFRAQVQDVTIIHFSFVGLTLCCIVLNLTKQILNVCTTPAVSRHIPAGQVSRYDCLACEVFRLRRHCRVLG